VEESATFTFQMQSSSHCSSAHSALNLNNHRKLGAKKGWQTPRRENVQGKERQAGEEAHISIPGVWKKETAEYHST